MNIAVKDLYTISREFLGVPYKHLGRSKEEGLDCYGLVLEFYRRIGMPLRPYLEPYERNWSESKELIDSNSYLDFEKIAMPRPGCVLAIHTKRSLIANHLIVCLDGTMGLNTDEVAGVHLLRLFSVRDKIVGCYARVGLRIIGDL